MRQQDYNVEILFLWEKTNGCSKRNGFVVEINSLHPSHHWRWLPHWYPTVERCLVKRWLDHLVDDLVVVLVDHHLTMQHHHGVANLATIGGGCVVTGMMNHGSRTKWIVLVPMKHYELVQSRPESNDEKPTWRDAIKYHQIRGYARFRSANTWENLLQNKSVFCHELLWKYIFFINNLF